MADNISREVASNISVTSIALLGVTFILVALAWKGFQKRYFELNRSEKRAIINRSFFTLLLVLIPIGITTGVGIYSPELVKPSTYLIFFGFGIIAFIYIVVEGIYKLINVIFKKKKRNQRLLNWIEPLHLISFRCFSCQQACFVVFWLYSVRFLSRWKLI